MYAYYFGLSGKSSSYDALWCRCSMMSKPVSMTVHIFSCHPKQLKSYLYLKYNNSENGRDGRVKGLLTSGLHTTLMVRRVYILTAEIAIKIFTTSVFFKVVFLRLWGTKKIHKWAGWII